MVNKNIGLLTMERMDNRPLNSVGSSRIRMRWLLPFWEEAEEYGIGKKYDVMIFQKVYWGPMMKAFKGIKILDLCDPDWLENRPVFEFVDLVDAVTTSTEALAEYVKKLRPDKIVRHIPDRVLLSEAVPFKQEHNEELRSVVWFGFNANSHYLESTYEELVKRGLKLTVISNAPVETPLSFRNKLEINNIGYSYESFNKEIIKHDAILMPEPYGDERAKYKSNNKTIQAWALGMPVIKVPDDIERLAPKSARIEEASANRKIVEEKYDVRYSVDEYKKLIEELRQKKNG